MVCLTSCVFRSIRFSGFARPHRLGCGARENYTRACRVGASVEPRLHRMDTNWGRTVVQARLCTAGEPPRRQPRPNGQAPPACRGPHVPCRPRRRIRPPACTGAPPCLPERLAARQAGPSHVWGPLAAHPHPRAHASLPGLLAYVRGPALADGLAAQGAARIHCQTRGAQCFGPPRPRLRRGRYGGPACPQLFARAASPRRHRRARAPRRPWGAGPKGGCRSLPALLRGGLAAGDVGLDAQHDAHREDADDRGDAGGR